MNKEIYKLQKENKMKSKLFILIVSILSAISINIDLNVNLKFIDSIGENNELLLIILTFLYYFMYKNVVNIKEKRIIIISIIISFIISLFQIIGYNISNYFTLSVMFSSKGIIIKNIIKLLGYMTTLYGIFSIVFARLLNLKLNKEGKKVESFSNNKKSFIFCFAIIIICYVPYFLYYYPGIFTTDSMAEMFSATFYMNNLTNHHPVFHIFIIHICLKIGTIFGSNTIGIAIYSIVQMIFTALVFSYVLNYLAKKNVNIYLRICCLVFFALYTPFAIYSVSMWKDVPFALFMLLYVVQLTEIVTNKEYFKSLKNIVKFLIITIMVILFRNNGIYVVLITLPYAILLLKGIRKKLFMCTIIIVGFYIIYKGPVFKLLNIKDGPIREALSVPIQQIARTVKYKGNELSVDEKSDIDKYLPVEEIGDKYYELISDNVKDTFNNEEFKNNKIDFIKIWGKLLIKYPGEYIDAFLDNSFGYWYLEANNGVIPLWYDYPQFETFSYEKHPLVNIKYIDNISNAINKRSIPIISDLWNIGFVFSMVIVCVGYVILKKKYKLLIVYVPIFALWLTTLASPVWCEYRYIYSIFTTLPITTILTISLANINNNEESFKSAKIKEASLDNEFTV